MKNCILAILSFLFLISGVNCSSANFKNQHIQREWMLVSFAGFTKDQLIANKAGIDLTGEKTDIINGNALMGCNRIFFAMEFRNRGKLNISDIKNPKTVCKNMDLENKFLESFPAMNSYKVEGHYLTLSDDKGNEMKFIAADWD
ncbi:META domain-containing protein [Chryseobacterium sp. GMJ5]|uniref:META domain-containing protein n=1 Tax=Chryseobacterium gilvum TaxID=2976534 RepID=A0ABT2VWR6_9FLAO|nr:META domain-containing protein [Chryseobacterium gilvum]MCU7614443.1 META domain-containing protein [Chryseobacterium gilvum]